MAKSKKIFEKVISGFSDANIEFQNIQTLLKKLNFQERIKGDHFIYTRNDIKEIINLQPKDRKAKPYQIKQIRQIIHKYQITLEDTNE